MIDFKSENSYYMDVDSFSSVSLDVLWDKLTRLVNDNARAVDAIKVDSGSHKIEMHSTGSVNSIVDFDVKAVPKMKKNFIRVLQLNLAFDKALKSLRLSTDNVESFPLYNTVSYQTACENKNIEDLNSLYFHESALVDYTKNFNKNDYLACTHYLMIVTYTATKTTVNASNGTPIVLTNDEMIFLCFDAATEKIVDVEFPVLNRDASIDVEKFIRAYNEDKSTLETAMAESSMIDGNAVFNAYTNFKSAMSMFKLMNDDELDFLNFKSFSTFMYDRFIKSLKTSLTRI